MRNATCDNASAHLPPRDEEGFRRLVEQHVDLVYGTALRQLGDASTAEEITQNVFIALARRTLPFPSAAALTGWLYKAALLQARQHWRTEARRKRREELAMQLGTTMKHDDSLLNSLTPLLDEALLHLREKERRALLLRYFEGKNMREVGAALGVSEDAAQKRVSSALSSLSAFFRRAGYAVTGTGLTAAALEKAAQAAPAGLASAIAGIAFNQAGAVSITGATLALAKLMTLTKTQTAAVCLALSAAPIAYQWTRQHALAGEAASLRVELAEQRRALDQLETAQAKIEAERGAVARQLAKLSAPAVRPPQPPNSGSDRFLWSDHLAYVNVPRAVLEQITIPAVGPDGLLLDDMAGALDLDAEQVQRANQALGAFTAKYRQLEAAHFHPTDEHPQSMHIESASDQKSFICEDFSEQYEAALTELRMALEPVLGAARVDYFWRNAPQSDRREFEFERAAKRRRMTLFRPDPEAAEGGPYILGQEYQYENGSWGSAWMRAVKDENEVDLPQIRAVIADWKQEVNGR